MKRGFTLIELIVVIIIVGILAAVGITQYSKTVEKGRDAEARQILGDMRKFAYEYYLQNNAMSGITNADLNVGTASSQFPGDTAGTCRSSHYFYYYFRNYSDHIDFVAHRCTAGGKSPQGTGTHSICLDYWFGTNNKSGWTIDWPGY